MDTITICREYLKENIEDFDIKVGLAWGRLDKYRCPLSMADPTFFDECCNCIEDFCTDEDIEFDSLFEEYGDNDFEDIILY